MNIFTSLRSKLILAFIGVAIIANTGIAVATFLLAQSTLTEQAGRALFTLAHSQSITVGNEVAKQIELLAAMSKGSSFQETLKAANTAYPSDEATVRARIDRLDQQWRDADAANNDDDPLVHSVLVNDLATELVNFKKDFPDHLEIFITDQYGASLASTDRTSDYNQADEDWWQAAYKDGSGAFYIGQPEYDESVQSIAVMLAMPVRDEATGEAIGVLRSTFNLQGFNQILASVRFGETGEADLVFPSGVVVGSDRSKSTIGSDIISQLQGITEDYGVIVYRDTLRVVSQARVISAGSKAALIDSLDWRLVTYQDSAEVLQPINTLTRNTIFVSAGVLLLAVLLAALAARMLAKPIFLLTGAAGKFAAGDLSVQAEVTSKDEIGKLAEAFNHMTGQLRQSITNEQTQRKHLQDTIARYADFMTLVMQGRLRSRLPMEDGDGEQDDPLVKLGNSLNEMTANLHRMIAQTSEAANNLSAAATEILAATTQQAAGAAEQSAAISQTTSTAEEVKVISGHSSLRLNEVANASQRAMEVARTGQKSVGQMIESMAQIKERVEAIAENTLALSEQTQQIGEIITTVNEIATQSNILALNASVEAARAGEHGKGFAVVAMEVRSLSEQSKQATAQVSAILSKIQKATNLTVMATEEGSKGVDEGVQLAAQARESIEKLSAAINEATQVAAQVVASGQQLQTGVDQIATAIHQISQVTIQSLSSTRQTEKSAQNLAGLARTLNEDISQYEL